MSAPSRYLPGPYGSPVTLTIYSPRVLAEVSAVVTAVSDAYGHSVETIVGPTQTGAVVWARQFAIYLAAHIVDGLDDDGLAWLFDGRTAGVVKHSIRRVEEQRARWGRSGANWQKRAARLNVIERDARRRAEAARSETAGAA